MPRPEACAACWFPVARSNGCTRPLAAKIAEYLGGRTGTWMATISYDTAAITPESSKLYDAIFHDSTTGEFLEDPNDKALREQRERALLNFLKSGKDL